MNPQTEWADGCLPTREQTEARLAAVQVKIAERIPDGTLPQWWHERVRAAPDRVALRTDTRTLTYHELAELAGRVARWGKRTGLQPGDAVAIQLPASPAFLALILGMAQLGIRLSLLGTGLRGRSLSHALREVPVRLVLTTPEASEDLARLDAFPAHAIQVLESHDGGGASDGAHAAGSELESLERLLARDARPTDDATDATAEARLRGTDDLASVKPDDTLFYIFTSGTTGLPKATKCSHRRYLAGACSEAILLDMIASDCMYVVLPMFHIAALSAIGAALSASASVVIRPRFSASSFWRDVHTFSATTFQYLGEILRYLIARPPVDSDRPNTLRAMIGAGVDAKIWRAFEARFGPVRILESYGSSEGVIGIFNLDGVVGSVGRPPRAVAERLALVRIDPARDELVRGPDGRLVSCDAGEAGELIARLEHRGQFEGYSSAEATQSRLLENSFEEGDLWYRSGDLFRQREGYHYFVARLGNTYRWKGENISAQQVADAASGSEQVDHAVVYGVEVPGHEGRAGMALVTIASGRTFDGETFVAQLAKELPAHAIPLFVRLGDGQAVLTDTYKLGLSELKRQGYALRSIADPLYVLDGAAACYVPLTEASLLRLRLPASDSDSVDPTSFPSSKTESAEGESRD